MSTRKGYGLSTALFGTLTGALLFACSADTPTEPGERTATTSQELNLSPTIGNFALYAERSVNLGSQDQVKGGDVGVAAATVGSFGPQLLVGQQVQVSKTNNLLSPSVSLGSQCQVGDVQTTTLTNHGAQSLGTVAAYPASLMPALPVAGNPTGSTSNVTVAAQAHVSLSPGAYGSLTIGNQAQVTLAAGSYSFSSVSIGNQVQIAGNSSGVTWLVSGTFAAGSEDQINRSGGTAASTLVILIGANDGTNGTPPAASIGAETQMTALVAAPHGTLSVASEAQLTGAFAAFDIALASQVQVTFQSGLPASTSSGQQGSQVLSGEVPPGLGTTYPLVGPLAGSTTLGLAIGLPLQNQAQLATFIQQVSDPTSPSYRQYLTPDGFAAAYGPPAGDYTNLQTFVTSSGLTVSATYTGRDILSVTGTAAAIESAFFVTLNVYQRPDGTTFYGPANAPSLNLTLSTPILHITGFDSLAVPAPAAGTSTQDCPASSPGYFGPDFRTLYLGGCESNTCPASPPAVGQGFGLQQTVALFELDSYTSGNVSLYESGTGLTPGLPGTPLCSPSFPSNVSQVVVPSAPATPLIPFTTTTFGPNTVAGESEVELGMEMVLAMAPQATVIVFEQNTLGGPAFNPDTIYDQMAENVVGTKAPPQVISNSWTWYGSVLDTNLPQIFAHFVAQGQSVFQAAGDLGAYVAGGAAPNVPDPIIDSALMTVVGGTTFGGLPPQEITWNDPSERTAAVCSTLPLSTTTITNGTCASVGGGGFCSGYATGEHPSTLALPTYQVGVGSGNPDITGGPANTRLIPDVSMLADDLATVTRATGGAAGCSQGTSASAALWAGFAAIANEHTLGQGAVGFANPQLYFLGSSTSPPFNDIGSGTLASNDNYSGSGQYSARAGYDLATGWGSPSATSCSIVTNLPSQSCMPGTSVSALVLGKNVTAYVPSGSYEESGVGVFAVPLEVAPSGLPPSYPALPAPVTISTGTDPVQGVINTCGGNSQTGKVVCTSNGNTVWLIDGTQPLASQTATSLTDGATAGAFQQYSGGDCQTCNVAIDPVHDLAYLSIATGTDSGQDSPGGAAFQVLNLATNTFLPTLIQTGQEATSEDVVVDPLRFGGLVLSPNEGYLETAGGVGSYQLIQPSTGSVFNFAPPGAPAGTSGDPTIGTGSGLDSAAEDCQSGIALATDEFTSSIFLVDLNQVVFSSGTLTWTAGTGATPGFSFTNIPDFASFTTDVDEAGTAGVAVVAQGTHVGVVTGEFGGGTFMAIRLPSASGSGTPQLQDYVLATIPSTPDTIDWALGADPHTLTAYMSPNSGQPYAVFEDDVDVLSTRDGKRTWLAVVDLNALLARPRSTTDANQLLNPLANTDTCQTTSTGTGGTGVNPSGCIVRFVGNASGL